MADANVVSVLMNVSCVMSIPSLGCTWGLPTLGLGCSGADASKVSSCLWDAGILVYNGS